MVRVSVVIITFNGEPWIRQCLLSLRTSTIKSHVIVVDNASSDNTVQLIEKEFPEVDLIKEGTNFGFGIANNIGICRAIELSSQYVFLLNQDAYVTAYTLEELLNFLDEYPKFGIASPLHCSPDLEHIDLKTYRGYLRTYAVSALCDATLGRLQPYYQVYGINAAAWLVRTDVFKTVGGFDPVYFMYGEDDDLIARFNLHSISFALLTHSKFVHLRESVTPSHTLSYWSCIKRDAVKNRAMLIGSIKHSHFSKVHTVLTLISQGLIRPFSDFLIDRNLQGYFSSIVAFFQLLKDLPRIRRHALLCATVGPHFLEQI